MDHRFPAFLRAAALCFLLASPAGVASAANRLPQGGGVIYPAWTATYWPNVRMDGKPSYVRSEARVRHDWEDWRPILGVMSESARGFPREGFSVRWTARLVARFAETYTFHLTSDEKATLRLRPEGGTWSTVVDAREPHSRRTDRGQRDLTPGTIYEVEIEYANLTGDAICSLFWSSPSTPLEVVDYVSGNSVHFMIPETLADLVSFSGMADESRGRPARSAELQGVKTDANGWPTQDFRTSLIQGYSHYAGKGLISFAGQAEVSISSASLEVDGKTYSRLPKGVGYNAQTNETRAYVLWPRTADGTTTSQLEMKDTQRTTTSPVGSGVTHLSVMLPTEVYGTLPHEPGTVIHQEARDAFKAVSTFRVQRTGLNDIVKWSERTRPAYSKIIGEVWRADMAYEKLIVAANELGRDLHLNFGGSCDEEFMRNLALLARYGSDGVNPYSRPTPNPVWPPLSPNLRLYLEHGNEMGWSAIQPRGWYDDYAAIRQNKGPIWDALNFDGAIEQDNHFGLMRYHAWRTARMSELMREVWGDEAMGDRIRVLLFGQYERWFQNGMVQYLNDYFGDPKHHRPARRPSELLWGAGPAVYYGTTNNFMDSPSQILGDGRFEGIALGRGEARVRPASTTWSFEGNAGVADLGFPLLEATQTSVPAPWDNPPERAVVGYQFTVGEQDLYVYQIGRTANAGERGRAFTTLLTMDGKTFFNHRNDQIDFARNRPGETFYSQVETSGWATTDASRVSLWRLKAGTRYMIVTEVGPGSLPGPDSRISGGPGLTIDGAVIAPGATLSGNGLGGGRKLERISGPGTGFPFVTFRYSAGVRPDDRITLAPTQPMLDATWVAGGKGKSFIPTFHRKVSRAAFIAGKGSITQAFDLPKSGEYALVFTANEVPSGPGVRDSRHPFTVRIDGKEVWNASVGRGRKPVGGAFQWGTSYLPLAAGRHTLEIATRHEDPDRAVYFYAMHLGDILDYAGGPTAANFLGAGAATGQTDGRFALVAELCTSMAQLWGLVPYAYEGGTQAGGDWNGDLLLYASQFKWQHPISKVADNQWAHYWHNFGGFNAFYYYPGYEYRYTFRAETFKPWEAAISRAHTWVMEPRAPRAAPVRFTATDRHFQSEPGSTFRGWAHPWLSDAAYAQIVRGGRLSARQWKGFVFRAPESRTYRITATTTAGGRAALIVNDSADRVTGASGDALSVSLPLTQGVHAVRLEAIEGTFDLESIEIR